MRLEDGGWEDQLAHIKGQFGNNSILQVLSGIFDGLYEDGIEAVSTVEREEKICS